MNNPTPTLSENHANTSPSSFWLKWLTIATLLTIAFGLAMPLAPEFTKHAFGLMVYQNMGHMNTFDAQAMKYIELAHAVMGSVMVGWGALMFMLARKLARQSDINDRRDTCNMLALSLLVWYVPDTAFSLQSGFWQNAILNTGFVIMLAPPLMALRPTASRSLINFQRSLGR